MRLTDPAELLARGPEFADAALEVSVVGSFSRYGYLARRALFDFAAADVAIGDAPGRVAVVTGASSGIGLAAACEFARRGMRVAVVSRDPRRNASAVQAVREAAAVRPAPGAVAGFVADVGDLVQIRRLAGELREAYSAIDVLVNCAGVFADRYRLSDQGIETTFAVHVVGPFLLQSLLLERLGAGARAAGRSARMIWVSSGGMYPVRLDLDRLEHVSPARFKGLTAYALAKRAQVELTREWARRLAGEDVTAVSMHPGWVDTGIVSTGLPLFTRMTRPIMRSPEQGADTAVWLGTAPDDEVEPGGFYLDRRPRHTDVLARTASTEGARMLAFARVARIAGAEMPPEPD